MRRFVFTLTVALIVILGLSSFPRMTGHNDTLPQNEPVSKQRTQEPSATDETALPPEVESYLQIFLVDQKRDINRPVGAGVCVDRGVVDLPVFGEQPYCRILSVAHVCSLIVLDDRHVGGDIHGHRFPVRVTDFHPFLDLCTMIAFHEFEDEARVIDLEPDRYGEAYNYSAPLGNFEAGDLWMLPMFTGHVLGHVGEIREHLLFSAPIHQGSSGSAVYQNGALIGVVTQRNRAFEHYSYAVRSAYIAQYLSIRGFEFEVRLEPGTVIYPP